MKTKLLITLSIIACICTASIYKSNKLINIQSYKNMKIYDQKTDTSLKLPDYLINDQLNILVFHSIDCPFNEVYVKKIDSISQLHALDSVRLIYINSNTFENEKKELSSELNLFIKRHNESYILDQKAHLKSIFNIKKNSTTVVCKQIKNQGIKVFYKGPVDDSPQSENTKETFLELALKNAMINKETKVNAIQTGCRIVNH